MPASTPTTRPATSQRVLSFSPKHSIGMVFVRPAGSDDQTPWHRVGEARWSVLIPEGMEARLWIDPKELKKALPILRRLPADSLAEVVFLGSAARDDDLRCLAGLTAIRVLDLFHTAVTDGCVEHLSDLTTLEWLSFTGTRFGDDGVRGLAPLTELRRLSLKDTDITDAATAVLNALPSLEWLSLSGTQITDDGLRTIGNSRSLRTLSVERTQISQTEVRALRSRREDINFIAH